MQLKKALKELERMEPDITREDRREFIQSVGFTEPTVSNYINGRGTNIDTAMKMLQFFRQRIAEREKILQQ